MQIVQANWVSSRSVGDFKLNEKSFRGQKTLIIIRLVNCYLLIKSRKIVKRQTNGDKQIRVNVSCSFRDISECGQQGRVNYKGEVRKIGNRKGHNGVEKQS